MKSVKISTLEKLQPFARINSLRFWYTRTIKYGVKVDFQYFVHSFSVIVKDLGVDTDGF